MLRGYIYEIGRSDKNDKYYGLISVDGEKTLYRFGQHDTYNCPFRQLKEGDPVEFETYETKWGIAAQMVRKLDQVDAQNSAVNPGINPAARLEHFREDEVTIIKNLGRFFYVTSGGEEFKINQSIYKYCLIKPTDFYQQVFHLTREIVVIFSDYVNFEPRSLDPAAYVYDRILSKLRLERGCSILVCHDNHVQDKLADLLRDTNLNQIVIPFTYDELTTKDVSSQFIQKRFKQYLFDADLFAVSAPITNDLYFFGRRDFVYDIVAKCKEGHPCGVFGLRRSGKTSLLYAVRRILTKQSYQSVYIPCESDLKELNWGKALYKVVDDLYSYLALDKTTIDELRYVSTDPTIRFDEDMDRALQYIHQRVTLIFDEIEAITFGVNQGEESTNNWFDGKDFCKFWDTIKGYYTKHSDKVSILVAGTNPMINEVPYIGEEQMRNPMYKALSESNQGAYLKPFSSEDVKNMVNTLGGYMGLSFNDYVVWRLTDDCGGHPYLIRILCSFINKYIRDDRPLIITKPIYDKALQEFEKNSEATSFYWMILNILMISYPLEYNTLKILALQGDEVISKTQDINALSHLLGYGLIEKDHDHFSIRFETIARYLREEYRFERQGLSIDDQSEEIRLRTNAVEIKLRKLVRNVLRVSLGPVSAKEKVLDAMRTNEHIGPMDIRKAEKLDYNKLFDTSVNNLPLSCLFGIILDNITIFKQTFEGCEEKDIREWLRVINYSRRCPAHAFDKDAEKWSWEYFTEFRETITSLEKTLKDYD